MLSRPGRHAALIRGQPALRLNSSAVAGEGLDTAFPDDLAFEIEYAPSGVDSGPCLGAATRA